LRKLFLRFSPVACFILKTSRSSGCRGA